MQPPGALGTFPVVEGPPGAGVPGAVDIEGAGVTLDEGVVDGVVVVPVDLGPPHPTAKTSTAAPPNSAIAVLVSDFIKPLHSPSCCPPCPHSRHAEPYRVGA